MKTKRISTEVNRKQVLLIDEKVNEKVFENILKILGKKKVKASKFNLKMHDWKMLGYDSREMNMNV